MSTTNPIVPHVILVERDDAVGVMVWSRPGTLLAMISPHFPIGRTKALKSPHAERIAAAIRREIKAAPGEHWAHAQFETALAELEAFDPETGKRVEQDDIQLHQRVYVRDLGAGVVTGFLPCGRIVVKLDSARAALQVVHARRSLVKPVLRPSIGGNA